MVDGEMPGVDPRDEGKHTGRKDLLFIPSRGKNDKCAVKAHQCVGQYTTICCFIMYRRGHSNFRLRFGSKSSNTINCRVSTMLLLLKKQPRALETCEPFSLLHVSCVTYCSMPCRD